ncbi:hypothetical protein FHS75_001442 [Novosphingobium marinum]|uniref:Uncharacterized protein n=1 Tax=Novosphingobium marinum TaxID=1514948 RepID=A0A7Y9XXL2_9SPHN|nr:hypothetical protein [Novosphingobium marinum]
MSQTCKTPPVGGGASRDQLGGWSRSLHTSEVHRTQFPMARRHGDRGDALREGIRNG